MAKRKYVVAAITDDETLYAKDGKGRSWTADKREAKPFFLSAATKLIETRAPEVPTVFTIEQRLAGYPQKPA